MRLSLSGRLVEDGGGTIVPVREFLDLAGACGYDAVDLRASQLAPDTPAAEVDALRAGLEANGLAVFEGQYGGTLDSADQQACFAAFAKRLADLGAEGVRIGGDLATLKRACRLAAPLGLRVLYQMHTGGEFETIASAARAIAEVGEPNFGVLPEPSNLLLAGETFREGMFKPLAGRIFGVHVQTLEVRPDAASLQSDPAAESGCASPRQRSGAGPKVAPSKLKLADGREVRYERVAYEDNHQIDFATFFAALRRVGFDGFVNELEPCPGPGALEETVRRAAEFLRPLLRRDRRAP